MIRKAKIKTLGAGEFKAHCLELLDEVQRSRVPVVITKRGHPVAQLVPVDEKPPGIFGTMRGTATITGDIIGPTGEKWDAER